jgi:hypothetical protein
MRERGCVSVDLSRTFAFIPSGWMGEHQIFGACGGGVSLWEMQTSRLSFITHAYVPPFRRYDNPLKLKAKERWCDRMQLSSGLLHFGVASHIAENNANSSAAAGELGALDKAAAFCCRLNAA